MGEMCRCNLFAVPVLWIMSVNKITNLGHLEQITKFRPADLICYCLQRKLRDMTSHNCEAECREVSRSTEQFKFAIKKKSIVMTSVSEVHCSKFEVCLREQQPGLKNKQNELRVRVLFPLKKE